MIGRETRRSERAKRGVGWSILDGIRKVVGVATSSLGVVSQGVCVGRAASGASAMELRTGGLAGCTLDHCNRGETIVAAMGSKYRAWLYLRERR